MRLQNEAPSKNFVDDSFRVAQGLLGTLIKSLDPYKTLENSDMPRGKNAYGKWLGGSFDDLSPEELKLMKSRGLSFRDIAVLREMQRGETLYPYGADEIGRNFK